MRRSLALAGALASLAAFAFTFTWPAPARAYCPSYTPADTAGGQNCGVEPAPGKNPSVDAWKLIFAKVAPGQASWGTEGPAIGAMGAGCGKPVKTHDVPAHFPCHVLEAIAMQESSWQQFCVPDSPQSDVGAPERTIVAFDCGYGVGQVTSGMHVGESPAFDRARVASDPTYNLATGTLILRDKWVGTSCVGDNDPDKVEDWYTAIWAYNGLAYSNNPNNPNLTSGRGPYDPKNGGSYTYQERVLGWMEHPPGGSWPVLAPAYPDRADVGGSGAPPDLPEPSCASPTSCAEKRTTHASSCGAPPVTDDAGAGAHDSGSPPSQGDAGNPRNSGLPSNPGAPGATSHDAPVDGSGGGCGCRVARADERERARGPALLVGLGALAVSRRRRARARRSAPR